MNQTNNDSTTESADNRRKLVNFWLDPKYQSRQVAWITLAGLSLVIVQSATCYYLMRQNYATLVDVSPLSNDAQQMLHRELNNVVFMLISIGTVFLSLIALCGLIFSHRTVGPIHHFKKVFDRIKNGDRDARVKLRPKDDFHEVADAFNEMMDSLTTKK